MPHERSYHRATTVCKWCQEPDHQSVECALAQNLPNQDRSQKGPPPYLIRTGAKEVPRQSHAAIPGNWETIHPGHAMHGMQESAIMVRSANFTMCAQSRAVEELTERMNAASAAKMSAGKGDEHHQLGHTVCHLANPRDSSSVTKQQVNC